MPLSSQQVPVLRGIASGLSVKEIATQQGLTQKSIDSHRYRIMRLLGIHNRIELTRYAIEHGYVKLLELPTTPEPAVLSERQREVVALTAYGLSIKEMAELLAISTRSADAHKHKAMHRLDIHDAVTLVHYCARHQLTPASKPDAVPLELPPQTEWTDNSAGDSDESTSSSDE
ncbi:MAG: DNA-binding NarL/FixJ family response regulator [Planctomycetaceae bacterium]|jgi:DNA-binding NarL/FixJ family response regulator